MLMLTKEQQKQAEALYFRMYNRTVKDDNIKVIDIYEPQSAYLYGRTKEALKAYKTSQNILRFMLTFFMWPVIADVLILFYGFFYGTQIGNIFNGYSIFGFVFFFLYCGVFFGILCYKCVKADKAVKGRVVWVNY